MSTYVTTTTRPPLRPWLAIVLAGVIAATCDLIFACTYNGIVFGVGPVRILQSIATGWLGRDSFDGGAASAALGFFSHYGILIIAASFYWIALRRMPWLHRHAYLYGVLFGACIYATMHLVILPLSNAPTFKPSTWGPIADFAMHVLVIGPAIALTLRRFAR